jgi:hypothetical protein
MAQKDFSTGTLAAYFEHSSDARKAVDALQKAGFSSAHLGIAHHGSYTGESTTFGNTTVHEIEEKEPSTWDKIKAWFSGHEAEARKEDRAPGDAANLEIAPMAAERFDDTEETSDLRDSFAAMNISDDRARYFAHRFGRGKDAAVVTVQADDRTAEAQAILAEHNADFGENAAAYDYAVEDESYAGRNIADDPRESERNNAPRDVQLLGVLRVQTVRVIPDNQVLGRKEPARDLSGDVNSEEFSEGEKKNRERSA